MLITIRRSCGSTAWNAINAIKKQAIKNTYRYAFKTNDFILDLYLKTNFNKGLRQICVEIIRDISVYDRDMYDMIITCRNKDTEYLADLITHGNLDTPGSNILNKIFCAK